MVLSRGSYVYLILGFLYFTPLAINAGDIGGAPVNFAVSNLMLLIPLISFFRNRLSKDALIILLFPLSFVVIGLASSIYYGGAIAVVLSMLSFVIPIFHAVVGAQLALILKNKGFSFVVFPIALLFIVFSLFFSDFFSDGFPRGCGYEGRWGGCLGVIDVYGFPNASMNFMASSSILLGLIYTRSFSYRLRGLSTIAFVLVGFLCFMSLSRSAVLVYFISALFFLYVVFGNRVVFLIPIMIVIFVFNFDILYGLVVTSDVFLRVQHSLDYGDITTGRLGIWQQAFSYFSENPLFGVGFLPFSGFSIFGTVHQQYLELLYKSGLIGFFVYFSLIFWGGKSVLSFLDRSGRDKREKFIVTGFSFCVIVACLFQPAISYQTLGNFLFFACGYFISKNRNMR